jgi:hypothetical protein
VNGWPASMRGSGRFETRPARGFVGPHNRDRNETDRRAPKQERRKILTALKKGRQTARTGLRSSGRIERETETKQCGAGNKISPGY